jgi:hypothetical protein
MHRIRHKNMELLNALPKTLLGYSKRPANITSYKRVSYKLITQNYNHLEDFFWNQISMRFE